MTRLTALSLGLTSALLVPLAAMPTAFAAEQPRCTTYTTEQEAGVTCTNHTANTYNGKLVVECTASNPKDVKVIRRNVTDPAAEEDVLSSVTSPSGTKPLPQFFTDRNK